MRARVEATIFLEDGEGKALGVEKIRDGRVSTIGTHYYVIRLKDLTMFVEPDSMDWLIKMLKEARKRKSFDGVIRDKEEKE